MAERPKFNIPKQELPSLRALTRMSPEVLLKLTEALAMQPPSLDVNRLAASVGHASGIEQSVVDEVLPLVWRWTMVQRRLDLTAEDFVTGLTAGLDALPIAEWSEEDRAGWHKVGEQLQRLLSSDTAVTAGAKASELLLDQQLILCSSRVITDMRAVFDDLAESIKGVLPFHTLVLRCHEGSDTRDIYVALTLDDLVLLRDQIERAEQKERLLRSSLFETGLAIIETNANNDS